MRRWTDYITPLHEYMFQFLFTPTLTHVSLSATTPAEHRLVRPFGTLQRRVAVIAVGRR